MKMKAIDMHVHYSTIRGYPAASPQDLKNVEKFFGFRFQEKTEEEMAEDMRQGGVQGILSFGTLLNDMPIEQVRECNDYAAQMTRDFPDVIIGSWFQANPQRGLKELRELERCLSDLKFVGLEIVGQATRIPASDKQWWPFYESCIEAKRPVLIMVGWGACGVGEPGGRGHLLDSDHPRHIDEVAARFPELTVIGGRVAWPWQNEMIGILLHKSNVWHETHGWLPKYFPQELKWDLARRLQDRIMWGSDYPYITYERYWDSWRKEGYSQEILDKVLYKNAQQLLAGLGKVI